MRLSGAKGASIVLGNLSLALIRQGKIDEVAEMLRQAINVVETTRGGGGLNVVFDAGRGLRRWRHVPAVDDVFDRLLTPMSAAA